MQTSDKNSVAGSFVITKTRLLIYIKKISPPKTENFETEIMYTPVNPSFTI